MQVLQAGQHKLILLELDLDLVMNIAKQAGFEVKTEDTPRSLILDLNATGKFPSLAEQALVLAREFRRRGSLFLPAYLPPLVTKG